MTRTFLTIPPGPHREISSRAASISIRFGTLAESRRRAAFALFKLLQEAGSPHGPARQPALPSLPVMSGAIASRAGESPLRHVFRPKAFPKISATSFTRWTSIRDQILWKETAEAAPTTRSLTVTDIKMPDLRETRRGDGDADSADQRGRRRIKLERLGCNTRLSD